MEHGGQRNGGGVGAAPAQGGNVLIFIHPLEPCDNDNFTVIQLMADALGVNFLKPGIAVSGGWLHHHLKGIQ